MVKLLHPFLKESALYGASRLMHAGAYFLAIIVLTRHLAPQDYGRAALFNASVLFMGGVLEFSAPIQRAFHVYPEKEFFQYLRAAFAASAVRAGQLGVVLAITGCWLTRAIGLDLLWFFVALATALLQAWFTTCNSYWVASRQAEKRARAWVIASLVYMAMACLFITQTQLGWLSPVLALLLSMAFAFSLSIVQIWPKLSTEKTQAPLVKDILKEQRSLLLYQLSAPVFLYGGQIVTAHYLSVESVGLLALATQCASIINLYAESIVQALVPWIQGHMRTHSLRQHRAVRMLISGYVAALLAVALTISLLAPWLVSILGGEHYQQAALYVPWICMAFAFGGITRLATPYVLFYTERFKHASTANIISLAAYFLCAPLLVNTYGLYGATWATLLSMALTCALWARLVLVIARQRNKGS